MIKYFLILLLLISFPISSQAQWTSIAPNLIGAGPYLNSGAMTYSDGVAWAGLYNLFKSTDLGLTWQNVSLPNAGSNNIHGITFYDKNTGIVCSDVGLYVTHDQGQTWKTFFNNESIIYGTFVGSPTAFAIGSVSEPSAVTTDDGTTWNKHAFTRIAKDFYSPAPGKIIAFIESYGDSHIATTSDYGVTWVEKAGTMDADAHSFGVIPCDESTIYGINEEGGNYTSNGMAEIFRSNDGGASFTSLKQFQLAALSGCICITPGALYIPARSTGILQSIDNGATWQSSAGPNVPIDSRDFIAINDTILLAADINGTIWRSINTAGKGAFSSSSSHLDVTSADVRNDTIGGVAFMPIKFKRNGALSSADFVLHYDWYLGLRYLGSFLTSGKQIDVAGTQTNGRTQLHIGAADLPVGGPELLGYARFQLYIAEGGCGNAWFDSLTFATPPSACFNYSTDSARAVICSNQSVQSVMDAQSAIGSEFQLSPNPTAGTTMLSTSSYSGVLTVRVVNQLGVVVQELQQRIDAHTPITLALGNLPAGEYFINLKGENTMRTLSMIRLK